MTLFSYEIFDAVARQGSFNKAAQQLHLTPSAISHAIAVMEEELGFALFNRGKNGVSMTSYGASLYPSIRAVLNSDEALKQSIARLNGLEKGKVKLGAFNSVCASLLPGLLKSFAAQYPQIEIEVYQGTYDDVKEWLRTGQVDIAFLSSTCKEEFNLTELFREPLLCIVPQDWPEPQDGVMTPALMNGQSFVVQCDATDAEMNPIMVDGTGMCGGCRLTVGGKTKFACVDGPDFDGFEVDFDEAMHRGTMYRDFEAHAREAECNLLKKEVE